MAETFSTPAWFDTSTLGKSATQDQNDIVLRLRGVEKTFGSRANLTHALNGVSLDIARGEFVGIMGASGSGKTTLLNCISTIDKPTSGSIVLDGTDVAKMKGGELSAFRRDKLGFVFQDANLLNTLTGFENIALGLTIKGVKASEIRSRVNQVAARLQVTEVLEKYPYQMSGGQRQRVTAARAIIGEPQLVLADEPTGALDSKNATIMLNSLTTLNHVMNATILMVTHDAYAASFASRVVFFRDGRVFNEIRRGDDDRKDFFTRIMEVTAFLGGDSDAV